MEKNTARLTMEDLSKLKEGYKDAIEQGKEEFVIEKDDGNHTVVVTEYAKTLIEMIEDALKS